MEPQVVERLRTADGGPGWLLSFFLALLLRQKFGLNKFCSYDILVHLQ